MVTHRFPPLRLTVSFALLGVALTALFVVSGPAAGGRRAKQDALRIGSTGILAAAKSGQKEDTALVSLKAFIKQETGMENEVVRPKDWREQAERMAKGDLQLGVFQGFEYAWAREKYPKLKPLALAVNVYTYPVGYVVARRDGPAKTFRDLQGQSLALPATGQRSLRLFLERQSQSAGKQPDAFFSGITMPDNVEDALDDVVDRKVGAAVVDRAALEAYKRRKPGRFKQLKEVARSSPFLPPLVAYQGGALDDATRERFRSALLRANRREKGQTLLTLFRLTGFVAPPKDFDQVLARTRKAYPPPEAAAK
jgi:ABC-type phosphate/phosphonate transport system substrate-binding protein